MASSGQKISTTRTAPKFCAKTQSECPQFFVLDPNPQGFFRIIEPWSACQPVESRARAARPEDSSINMYIYIYILLLPTGWNTRFVTGDSEFKDEQLAGRDAIQWYGRTAMTEARSCNLAPCMRQLRHYQADGRQKKVTWPEDARELEDPECENGKHPLHTPRPL